MRSLSGKRWSKLTTGGIPKSRAVAFTPAGTSRTVRASLRGMGAPLGAMSRLLRSWLSIPRPLCPSSVRKGCPSSSGVGGVQTRNDRQPHAKRPRRASLQSQSKRTGKPCLRYGYRVCRMHGARGGAPTGKRNGKYRDGMRTKEAVQAARLISLLSRFARKS